MSIEALDESLTSLMPRKRPAPLTIRPRGQYI